MRGKPLRLLTEPPRADHPRKHVHFGKPAERVLRVSEEGGRPSRKFFLLIEPTKPLIPEEPLPGEKVKSQRALRLDSLRPTQRRLYDILTHDLGITEARIAIKGERAKITHTDSRNGVQGWYTPLLRVGEVYLELTMGTDTIAAAHRVAFFRQHYGKPVVHLTADNFYQVRDQPELLLELMGQAAAQISSESYEAAIAPKKRAQKPKKGRRGGKKKPKTTGRPSRDAERQSARRAIRKLARDLVKAEVKLVRQKRMREISAHTTPPALRFQHVEIVRKGIGPKPPGISRVNVGPLGPLKNNRGTIFLPIAA
jgi:hypothetical protein